MKDKIHAALMIEILGKPADYLKEALGAHVDKMETMIKDLKITKKKIAEPKEVKEGIFTTFAEVEIETDYPGLSLVTMNFMPSHIEVITPEEVRINNTEMNEFFNDLTRKLHQYDEITKAISLERDMLIKQLQELQEKLSIKNAITDAVTESSNIPLENNIVKKEDKKNSKKKK